MITIQYGQCGNQLGHALFSKVSEDFDAKSTGVSRTLNYEYKESGFDRWYKGVSKDGRRLARAILVDTEQKVVNNVYGDSPSSWTYSSKNLVCQAGGGSANNWAYGYSIKGHQLGEATLEVIRREIERADRFEGVFSLLSSAGGTGSGVGSHICELLRNEFPTKSSVSAIVLPYTSGEVATQNYNTLLTLAKFYDISDAVFLFENEQIHKICASLLRNLDAKLSDMNAVIAQKLAAVFQPVADTRNNLSRLVSQLTPHPQYKLATVKTTPYAASTCTMFEAPYKWQPLVHHLKKTLRVPSLGSEITDVEMKMPSNSVQSARQTHSYCRSVSNLLVTRGTSLRDDDTISPDELRDKTLYPDWVPLSDRLCHMHQPRCLLDQDKFAALVTNNSTLHRPIDAIVNRAWTAYTHAAFLHQYKRYDVGEDEFLHAFAKVENVIKAYKEL